MFGDENTSLVDTCGFFVSSLVLVFDLLCGTSSVIDMRCHFCLLPSVLFTWFKMLLNHFVYRG